MRQNLKKIGCNRNGVCSPKGWRRGTIISVCRQQWSMVQVPCKFGAAFLQMELKIWSGLMAFLMLRNTSRYLPIMQYHQGGVWLATNLFCSRRMTPNITPRSLRTIFSIGNQKTSWKCWHSPLTINNSIFESILRSRFVIPAHIRVCASNISTPRENSGNGYKIVREWTYHQAAKTALCGVVVCVLDVCATPDVIFLELF